MRPLTHNRPKVMLPIANKPILEHLLIEASRAGIKEFIFIVGYRDEQVRDYFGKGDRWGVSIEYCSQRKQLGTADALRMVDGLVEENFLVINGDIIVSRADIKRLARKKGHTLSVVEVADNDGLGVVEMSKGRVDRIHEKENNQKSRHANAGLYLFTAGLFDAISRTSKSSRGEYELTDSLKLIIEDEEGIALQAIKQWLNLSYPWDLLAANESLLAGIKANNLGEVEEGAKIQGLVAIGKNSVVMSGAYIVGPVVIGQDCKIGPNCFIRPYTSIGDGCHIGSAVEVKNSIIMKGSKLPHHNYVGDSIIGEGCNFGAGTKVANLRLDKKEIWVDGVNTKRRKLGAIIGDGVETGINSCINVGSMIGGNTLIGPGAMVSGVILPGSRIL